MDPKRTIQQLTRISALINKIQQHFKLQKAICNKTEQITEQTKRKTISQKWHNNLTK